MIGGALPSFDFVNTWIAAMGRASLEGAIAIGLAWLVCRSIPRLPASVRCWLWRLALLKMVLAAVPLGSVDLPLLPRAWTGELTMSAIAEPDSAIVMADVGDQSVAQGDSPADVRADGAAEASSSVDRPVAPSTQANVLKGRNTRVAFVVLFAVWLAVLTAFVGVVVVRVRGARRWRQQWRMIKDRDILTLNERLAGEYRLFQPPVLFEAENCESPVVFGAVRTVIVLPSALLAHSTANQLRLILAHEMAHIRRGDLLGNWFSTLVSGLFFFHPLVWLALRESRLSQEVACDELAVRRPDVSVADYGRLLVELATQRPMPASPLVTVGVVESFHVFLKRRLSAMKNFGTRSRRVFALSWFVAIVAVLGLLPWRLVAQTESDEVAAEKALKSAHEQVMKVDATSGPYKITVDRVRYEPGHHTIFQRNPFPPYGLKGSQQSETKTFQGPNGSGQATAAGAGLSGGGGMGGVFTEPDLILDLSVKGPLTGKKHQLICGLNGKVTAVDDQGHTLDCPTMPAWMRLEMAGVEYDRGPGKTNIHLALSRATPPARYLTSVEGELLVAEAIVNQLTFRGKDLSRPSKKQANGISAQLHKISQSPAGIDVELNVGSASGPHNEFRAGDDPMEHLKKMMLANAPGRVSVMIEDSEGKMHSATASKTHNGSSESSETKGPNGTRSFSRTSRGGSVSISGGGSGGSFGGSGGSFGGGTPNDQHSGNISSADSGSGYDSYHFDALPEGVTLKSIVCRVTDFQGGEPKAVPFHFSNIQLPDSRK